MAFSNILLLLCTLTVLGKNALALCPAAYTDLGTGCYHFTVQEQLTWEQAYFICQLELKGYLVEIESSEEQNNIGVYITAVVDPSLQKVWWIGATDILSEGTFRWMTSGNELSYTSWDPNQPDDLNNAEDCAYLHDSTYMWHDENCSNFVSWNGKKFGAVCETDPIE